MEYKTIAGNFYTITSKDGCTVTDATGTLSMTVDAGGQLTVQAPSDKLVYDDEQAIVFKANFNHALAVAGLLGGGADKLPAGYTRVAFLGCTGTQYIDTGLPLNNGSELTVDCEIANDPAINSGGVFGAQEGSSTRDRVGWSEYVRGSHVADFHGWVFWGSVSEESILPSPTTERHRVQLSQSGLYYNGNQVRNLSAVAAFQTSSTCWLFARNRQDVTVPKYHGKIYSFTFAQDGKPKLNFMPCVDNMGEPCMFDLVSKQPFKNEGTGEFIAGCTLAQASQLGRKLPSTGGKLTVSLPEGYEQDERVVESLAQTEAKGWVLTIQTYAAQAAAATFALRRVWVRRVQDENGSYVAADGSRWQVEWCVDVIGADPESLGYERFRSVDAATEYWGLVPYEHPEAELSTAE